MKVYYWKGNCRPVRKEFFRVLPSFIVRLSAVQFTQIHSGILIHSQTSFINQHLSLYSIALAIVNYALTMESSDWCPCSLCTLISIPVCYATTRISTKVQPCAYFHKHWLTILVKRNLLRWCHLCVQMCIEFRKGLASEVQYLYSCNGWFLPTFQVWFRKKSS